MRRLIFVLGLMCAVSIYAQSGASQTGQVPTFRSAVNIVPLSVVVLDRQGRPVTDLKPSDFTIIEDGKPREILSFSQETFSGVPAGRPEPVSADASHGNGIRPETRRTFLLILGYGRIQYPTKAVDGVREFMRTRLMPQDLVAVMAFNRSTEFTTDHAALDRVLERFKRESERLEFDINQYWVHNPTDRLSDALQSAIDDVFLGPVVPDGEGKTTRDGSVRDSVGLLLGMSSAGDVQARTWNRPNGIADLHGTLTRPSMTLSDLMVRSPLLKVYAGVEFLRHREGQRNLVYLGPRLPIQDKRDELRLAQRANHAQVTLHIIGTSGVPPNAPTQREAALALANLGAIQGMQYLTAQTGGGYTGLRFAVDALADIDRASRSYYLIGYQPVSVEDDRKYRRVDVRVARRDVNVRFRSGYFATGQPDAAPLPELLAQARVESTVNFDFDVRDIPVKGTATFRATSGNAGEIHVSLAVDATRAGFQPKGALRSARLGLTMVAMNNVLTMFGGGGGTVDLEVDDHTYASYEKDGVPVSITFPVAEKPKRVKVIVYAFGSDLIGTVNLPVR